MNWLRVFGTGFSPYIAVWESGSDLVALLPLARRQTIYYGTEVRHLNGDEVAPDRLDILVDPDFGEAVARALPEFFATLRRSVNVIRLDNSDADGLLRREWERSDVSGPSDRPITPQYLIPGVELPPTFDEYLRSRSRNLRMNFARRSRQIQRETGAHASVLCPKSDGEAEKMFDQLWTLHADSFGSKGETDYFSGERVRDFHRAVVRDLGPLGFVRFAALLTPEQTLASMYLLVHSQTTYYYQMGYLSRFRRLSPGVVVLGSAIREAIDSGCRYFDLLRGEESYKRQWSNAARHTVSLQVGTLSARYKFWEQAGRVTRGLERRLLRRNRSGG